MEGASLPEYGTEGAAGFDLVVHSFKFVYSGSKDVTDKLQFSIQAGYINLRPKERALVGAGFSVELPEGKELQIRARSGMALKKGLSVLNSPGTIDSDYRGEVGAIIYNSTDYLIRIDLGDRIAQGVIADVYQADWEQVDELSTSTRGENGFGSTGVTAGEPKLFDPNKSEALVGPGYKVVGQELGMMAINKDGTKTTTKFG